MKIYAYMYIILGPVLLIHWLIWPFELMCVRRMICLIKREKPNKPIVTK